MIILILLTANKDKPGISNLELMYKALFFHQDDICLKFGGLKEVAAVLAVALVLTAQARLAAEAVMQLV